MNLFQKGDFQLHSGGKSEFKIDCDALSEHDWETLAYMTAKEFRFKRVVGVPEGGLAFARALETLLHRRPKPAHPAGR